MCTRLSSVPKEPNVAVVRRPAVRSCANSSPPGWALITAALAGLVGLVAAPRLKSERRGAGGARSRRSICRADGPATAVLADRQADGWYETRKQSIVFIDREGDGYRALSATCSHLGCRVNWDAADKQFMCPCHGGVYDRDGTRRRRSAAGAARSGYAVRVNPQTSEIEVEL